MNREHLYGMHIRLMGSLESTALDYYIQNFDHSNMTTDGNIKLPTFSEEACRIVSKSFIDNIIGHHTSCKICINYRHNTREEAAFMVYAILRGRKEFTFPVFYYHYLPPYNSKFNSENSDLFFCYNPQSWHVINSDIGGTKILLTKSPGVRGFVVSDDGRLYMKAFEYLYPEKIKPVTDKLIEIKLTHVG